MEKLSSLSGFSFFSIICPTNNLLYKTQFVRVPTEIKFQERKSVHQNN